MGRLILSVLAEMSKTLMLITYESRVTSDKPFDRLRVPSDAEGFSFFSFSLVTCYLSLVTVFSTLGTLVTLAHFRHFFLYSIS